MTRIFLTAWRPFGPHARMGEGIKGDTNLKGLLLSGHTDNFSHQSLQ
jgi:hypothetical protein